MLIHLSRFLNHVNSISPQAVLLVGFISIGLVGSSHANPPVTFLQTLPPELQEKLRLYVRNSPFVRLGELNSPLFSQVNGSLSSVSSLSISDSDWLPGSILIDAQQGENMLLSVLDRVKKDIGHLKALKIQSEYLTTKVISRIVEYFGNSLIYLTIVGPRFQGEDIINLINGFPILEHLHVDAMNESKIYLDENTMADRPSLKSLGIGQNIYFTESALGILSRRLINVKHLAIEAKIIYSFRVYPDMIMPSFLDLHLLARDFPKLISLKIRYPLGKKWEKLQEFSHLRYLSLYIFQINPNDIAEIIRSRPRLKYLDLRGELPGRDPLNVPLDLHLELTHLAIKLDYLDFSDQLDSASLRPILESLHNLQYFKIGTESDSTNAYTYAKGFLSLSSLTMGITQMDINGWSFFKRSPAEMGFLSRKLGRYWRKEKRKIYPNPTDFFDSFGKSLFEVSEMKDLEN